jgi:hypothetical protein
MKKTQHPQKSGLEGSAVFFILKNPVGCNRVFVGFWFGRAAKGLGVLSISNI